MTLAAKVFRLSGIYLMAAMVLQPVTVLTLTKTPYEVFLCAVDFVQVVGTDSITLDSVTARNVATNADATALIVATSPVPGLVPSTKKIAFAVKGGTSGATYSVSVKVIDDVTTEKFEGQVTLTVKQ